MDFIQSVVAHHIDAGKIERDGYGLRYQIEGSGLSTFVIGSAIYYPRTFSENLRKHLRLAFVDHRCFALSRKAEENPRLELDIILDDMEHVRIKLGLGRMVVVGHSGHGFMALEYAKKYPEHVSHVVLIGHGPDLSAKSAEMADQNWQAAASVARKAALEDGLLRLSEDQKRPLTPSQLFIRQYVRHGARLWYDDQFDASTLWEGVDINIPLFSYVWGTVFRDIDITKGLDIFKKPVFLALGKYDFLVGAAAWDDVLNKFHDITKHVFEHSGHTPQYEEAGLFDQKLLTWLSSH